MKDIILSLIKNEEIEKTMGFAVGKTARLVASKVYPATVTTYVSDTGCIGNSHYLAIPFNAPEQAAGSLSLQELTDRGLPEMKSAYIDWIKTLCTDTVSGKQERRWLL